MTLLFIFTARPTTWISTLSLHDALPISIDRAAARVLKAKFVAGLFENPYVDPDEAERVANAPEHRALALEARSEEHTSELQSRFDLVCRLLLEKKNSSFV